MADLIQIRRDTKANWIAANPTLAIGEMGFIMNDDGTATTNPIRFKVGNGTTRWSDLPEQVAGGIAGDYTNGNFVIVNAAGQLEDGGKSASSFLSASLLVQATGSGAGVIMSQRAVTDFVTGVSSSISTSIASGSSNLSSSLGAISSSLNARDNQISSSLGSISSSLNTRDNQISSSLGSISSSIHSDMVSISSSLDARDNQISSSLGSISSSLDSRLVTASLDIINLSNKKANIDGYYSDMAVGLAENLISPTGVINNEPYIYRTTAGSTSVSNVNAEFKKIEGNSIVWNQLVDITSKTDTILGVDYVFSSSDNSIKADGVSTGSTGGRAITELPLIEVGHKVYIYAQLLDYTGYSQVSIRTYGNTIARLTSVKGIYTVLDNTIAKRYITINHSTGVELHLHLKLKVFDLTQMFGAGNEPATVEEFEKLFPNDYYEYNEGEILSTNINSLKSVEFNQYNHTTGKADVIKGNQYQITGTYTAITYSDSTAITPDSNGLFTPTKNDTLTITGGNNTNTCVHLTWSGYRNGDYEPYEEHTISIPISSIKDANNNVLFPDGLCSAGSVYDEITSTKAIKRIGKVDLGTLNWSKYDEGRFTNVTLGLKGQNSILCSKYQTTNNINLGDKIIVNNISYGSGTLWVIDSLYTDAVAFKTAMSGVYLYYELGTPIEVNFSEVPQDFGTKLNLTYKEDDFGTEEVLPNGVDENGKPITAPFKHTTLYQDNLRDKLRNIVAITSTKITNLFNEIFG